MAVEILDCAKSLKELLENPDSLVNSLLVRLNLLSVSLIDE